MTELRKPLRLPGEPSSEWLREPTPYDAIADTAAVERPDMVNHPPHYAPPAGIDFECIELSRRHTFDVGNAIKYMWRTDAKNGLEDVKKAHWYIVDAIESNDVFDVDKRPTFVAATRRMSRQVAAAQTDPARRGFWDAIAQSNLFSALAALNALMDAES